MLIVCLSLSVPDPVVTVAPAELVLIAGSPLSIMCSIQFNQVHVDTPFTIESNWTTYTRYETYTNDTNVTFEINSTETSDSGTYVCSAQVTDGSSSYVPDSKVVEDDVNITISKFYCITKK